VPRVHVEQGQQIGQHPVNDDEGHIELEHIVASRGMEFSSALGAEQNQRCTDLKGNMGNRWI
jgi:hypothetical protein